jgi:hypothetical protein
MTQHGGAQWIAEWQASVQRSADAAVADLNEGRIKGTGRRQRKQAARLSRLAARLKCSDLGQEAANILGQVYQGIYHIQDAVGRTDWSNPHHIEVTLNGELASWDFNHLTSLIVLCHDRAVRVAVEGTARRYLTLRFHRRRRQGGTDERHPHLDEHAALIRAAIGLPIV